MLTALPAIILPVIDPIMVSFGPVAIRWYAMSYVAGILLGWWLVHRLNEHTPKVFTQKALDDIIIWAIFGIILGGRIGYILFYNLPFYAHNPADILKVWQGGMSFHGGLLGVIIATWLFAKRHKLQYWRVIDLLAIVTPIGLCLGRLANFINGELYGRAASVQWAMIFPTDETGLPRHPSQLYESATEGVLLFIIMLLAAKNTRLRAEPGRLSGIFLIGYGTFRAFCEHFREPDAQLGFIASQLTMGQLLCVPMVLYGIYLLRRTAPAIVKIPAEPNETPATPVKKRAKKAGK